MGLESSLDSMHSQLRRTAGGRDEPKMDKKYEAPRLEVAGTLADLTESKLHPLGNDGQNYKKVGNAGSA